MKDGVMQLSGGKVFQTQEQHVRGDASGVGGTTESRMTVAARARRRVIGDKV